MIAVKLIAKTDVSPLELASHAALTCYQAKTPSMGRVIDVENALFLSGHHTTMEHTYFTFEIDGIAVGDVDFGLHLATPHYNTDQRSGRYARMFDDPEAVTGVVGSIAEIYPDLDSEVLESIGEYLSYTLKVFHDNQEKATSECLQLHQSERPKLNKAIKLLENMPKLAQEQLRAFIPIIVPSGLDYTVDLITLAGLYHSAWSPSMRKLTEMMVKEVLLRHPDLEFIFSGRKNNLGDFSPKFTTERGDIINGPRLELQSIEAPLGVVIPRRENKHPIDQTTIHPSFMDNEVGSYLAKVECTLMTYGQDQRHRSNRRSRPVFTGNFLLSTMLDRLGLSAEAKTVMEMWYSFSEKVPGSLLAILAPYGATITYYKRGSLNALCHEAGKRLCFCAQGEIYELMRQLRLQLEENPEWEDFLPLVEPPCFAPSSSCAEPNRYCGRDMQDKINYFPLRSV